MGTSIRPTVTTVKKTVTTKPATVSVAAKKTTAPKTTAPKTTSTSGGSKSSAKKSYSVQPKVKTVTTGTKDVDPQLDPHADLGDFKDGSFVDDTGIAKEKQSLIKDILGVVNDTLLAGANLITQPKKVTSGGYGTSEKTNSSKKTEETAESVQVKIDENNGKISKIYEDSDKEIKEQETLIEKELKEAGLSDVDYQNYQLKADEINNLISQLESALLTQGNTIASIEAAIKSNMNYIAMLDAQIAANQKVSNSNSSEVLEKIENLQKEKANIEANNVKLMQNLADAYVQKSLISDKINNYNTQKSNLLEYYAQKCPSSALLTENLKIYTGKISEIKISRDATVAEIQKNNSELLVKKTDLTEKSARTSFIKKNAAESMRDAIDFGLSFDGKTASQMKKIMNNDGYAFYEKAWCGQFQSYIINKTIGLNNTASWYKNCSNRASCPTLLREAKAAGAVVKNSEAKPGDLLLLTKNNGHAYHVAMIVSVNSDGSFNTIEGNTSDDSGKYTNGVVNQRHRKANSGVVVRVSK